MAVPIAIAAEIMREMEVYEKLLPVLGALGATLFVTCMLPAELDVAVH